MLLPIVVVLLQMPLANTLACFYWSLAGRVDTVVIDDQNDAFGYREQN